MSLATAYAYYQAISAGATVGGAVGSVVPGAGTALGAVVGGAAAAYALMQANQAVAVAIDAGVEGLKEAAKSQAGSASEQERFDRATGHLTEQVLLASTLIGIKKGARSVMDRGKSKGVTHADYATPEAKKQLLPGEGQVGTYGELVAGRKKGNNLAAHHIPNSQYMQNKGVSHNDGVSMMVEQPTPGTGGRHREIHKQLQKQDPSLAPRDALAESVQRAREVYRQDGLYPEIRPKLLEVIEQNKAQHPNLFNK